MGRKAKAQYRIRWKGDLAYVRYTYEGVSYDDEPTGARDEAAAHKAATQIVAAIHAGTYRRNKDRQRVARAAESWALEDLTSKWLVDFEAHHPNSETHKTWGVYARKWLTFFCPPRRPLATIADVTTETIVDFTNARLLKVQRATVVKERSALRVFLQWCVDERLLAKESLPVFGDIPKKMSGNRSKLKCVATRKTKTVSLSTDEVYRVIENLPERGAARGGNRWPQLDEAVVARIKKMHKRGLSFQDMADELNRDGIRGPGNGKWHRARARLYALDLMDHVRRAPKTVPVKARVIVQYETSLRPRTVQRLRAGVNYTKGSGELFINKEIDKNEYERTLKLSHRARAALDSVCPDVGLIFPGHHRLLIRYLREAAVRAKLDPKKAEEIANYDLRHARATHLLEAGASLPGAAFVLGHLQVTTMSRYTNLEKTEGDRAIEAAEAKG